MSPEIRLISWACCDGVLQLIRLDGREFIYLELSVIDLNKLLK